MSGRGCQTAGVFGLLFSVMAIAWLLLARGETGGLQIAMTVLGSGFAFLSGCMIGLIVLDRWRSA